jgi:hypothetical protein
MANGDMTWRVAQELKKMHGVAILHDHGQKETDPGKIYSYLKDDENKKPKRDNILGDLDIAVIYDKNKVHALIEIEETTAKPKVILSDILAILLGNAISSLGKDYAVDEQTVLIVMVHDVTQSHCKTIAHLAKQINLMKKNLTTINASLGRIMIEPFKDYEQLKDILTREIEAKFRHGNL